MRDPPFAGTFELGARRAPGLRRTHQCFRHFPQIAAVSMNRFADFRTADVRRGQPWRCWYFSIAAWTAAFDWAPALAYLALASS